MIDGLRSQIEDMRKELREYDSWKKARALKLNGFAQMAMFLTQARIARGYTQKDLAEKLRLKPQQIQRYEATGYSTASLRRIQEIMRTLQVDIVADIPLRTKKAAGGAATLQRASARTA
ncbi:MAG: helix-turn-helix transcriptional regulator [Candidatus Sumerlaeota bacterium]|nr:helix-turn-helix transcriptional regulator [Candidatus Sumerlaeota bacterium]